ncbi:MAG: dihydrolipoyl dehydrogenase [Candidatus Aminicenantes bacterium]|nr:MAG: dihydrolipoyl dehydrogenase [Candidatus Aminicenantes bacterium]
MKKYDVIVVGSGAGSAIVDGSLAHGLRVALVDKGPLGGTCLNVGCIPSKMLIFPADRIVEIQEAKKHGIHAEIKHVDFHAIMERTRKYVAGSESRIRQRVQNTPGLDFYGTSGHFVADYTMEVGGEKIRGKKIYLVSGARPLIPPIKGIEKIDFLTNDNVFGLKEKPGSLIIIGGGYVATEFAHFFAALGTKVTILQRGERLVKEEEPEICDLLKEKMQERMAIHTDTEAIEAKREDGSCRIFAKSEKTGGNQEFVAEKVLIAAGRVSNADLLKTENTGVKTDKRGYIKVDNHFKTSQKNIWAFGDAIGRKMFRHAANKQADIVWHNSMHDGDEKFDFLTVPHAVFTYPPIASVGMGEAEAKKIYDVVVGKSVYSEVAKGFAMQDNQSFVKAIIEKESWRILGFHIIGPYAPILIQEVINAMSSSGTVMPIVGGMRIHPALPEIILDALGNLREPN